MAGTSKKKAAKKKTATRRGAAKPKLLCFTKYVKVTFVRGTSLRPLPPVESKHEHVRYFHIHEGDQLDEELVANWIREASELPGDEMF